MSSGPSFALVLTKGGKGENVLQEWREMLGPPTVEKAKEEAPERWFYLAVFLWNIRCLIPVLTPFSLSL